MAPAPPGNKSPDWPIRPCCVTSPPRAPPLPGAPAHRAAGGRKARSHCGGAGEQPEKAVRKPAKCSTVGASARARGRGRTRLYGGRKRKRAPPEPRPLPHANARAPRAVPPSLQSRLSEPVLALSFASLCPGATSRSPLPPLLTEARCLGFTSRGLCSLRRDG